MSNTNKLYHLLLACAAFSALGVACTEKHPAEPPQVSVTVLERIPKGAERKAPPKPTAVAGSPEDLARRYQVPVTSTQANQGPEDALVTMVTWCDFRSQTCRDADKVFKAAMSKYKGKLRWVWRHNPTEAGDMTAHLMAQSVFDIGKAEKFWTVRDRLLKTDGKQPLPAAELSAIVESTGLKSTDLLRNAKGVGAHVDADLRFSDQFGVIRPLGVFVNGKRVALKPVPELQPALNALIEEELEHATQLVASGVPKATVYKTIIDDGYWGIADDPDARMAALAKAAAEQKAAPEAAGTQGSAPASDKPGTKAPKQPKAKTAPAPGARGKE
jgi:protein-disulfide isomerase